MRVVLIVTVIFITFGSANVSIAQEMDTTNKLPEEELGSLDTSDVITEGVPQEKPAEAENLEEILTTDELEQNPEVLEQPIADSDDSDLTVVNSGDFWTIYRNTANGEYSLHMFGNVPSSKPSAWNGYLNRINHIEIEEATLTGDFESYFRSNVFLALESVRIERSNLSGVTSFANAFYASRAEKIIIKDNDYPTASSLLTTENMFKYCSSLTELDVSGLDTSAVTNMTEMFYGCNALKELDASNFDTSSVTDMNSMFISCSALEKLDVSNFDTSSVTDMNSMFRGCSALKKLDASNFDTSSVTNMNNMFFACASLEELNASNFDTSSVTDMNSMFRYCNKLKKLDISNFDTSSVTDMNSMFRTCSALERVDVSNFDTSSVTDMNRMFDECKSLEILDVSNFDTNSVTDMGYMFYENEKLKKLDLSNFDTSSVTDMSFMFFQCTGLEELDVSNFDTNSVTNMSYMFYKCAGLEELDLSNFDTSSVTDMSFMFFQSTGLKKLDLSNFDTSSVTNMSYMFATCTALKSLYLDNFTDVSGGTVNMFIETSSLTYLFVSHNFKDFSGLENTNWYDEKNWAQFTNRSELQTYHQKQIEPTGYRKGVFHSLTMDAMGGQFDDAEEQKVQNKVPGDYWEEMIPVKEDYYFDGWYVDQDFTSKFDFSMPATASTTIYAKWIENYTVVIPASISLNETSELKVEGINRGSKTLSVGLNRTATSISESNELTLAHAADTTIQCLAPLSWDGSENNPKNAILTLAPGSEITEGDAVMDIEAPEDIQAGKYTGNLVFSIKYE
ncbi:BspA family leucine-rich repeat surface protein [Listeria monocytogenes]|nr:BspA family leucine-rich repeat surface protein [Listeria monocytogenes]MCF2079346.1 BspA family leucine-rich repeat surface protein [Listeria monocytogenes]MCF2083457.1 BspA family leucine-rich repeat surface protein [Listeria monocytogenes]MCH4959648.1 BspA family leucine-rich repeat surface protein [Listeria monocytogenes]MCR6305747.1 BspA family leucine-rich repeat surface protein [Listeria monocytogenes]MCR6322793.1 BspA family leucine-rich repeat surface protein [Listeria monocytogene